MSTLTAPTQTGSYAVDPTHSRIGFVARHAMVTKVRGSFNEFEGSGYFDAGNPANSSLQLTIQVASIDTRNADRDGHLKSNDFFDMETYPEITFSSTAIEQVDDTKYRVTGDLTIKGTTKPVSVDFEYAGTAVLYGTLPFDAGVPTTPGRLDGRRVLVIHGDQDTVIPRELLDRTWSYLDGDAGSVTTAIRDAGGHGLRTAALADVQQWLTALLTETGART